MTKPSRSKSPSPGTRSLAILGALTAPLLVLLVLGANGIPFAEPDLVRLGFGGESSYVAQSLLRDGAYANPFGPVEPTGPTGWCLPAYVGWVGFIYGCLGVGNSATGLGFLVLDVFWLSLASLLTAQIARRHLGQTRPLATAALFWALLFFWIRRDGGGSSDKFFVIAMDLALIGAHLDFSTSPTRRARLALALLGGLAGLVNVGAHLLALGLAASRFRPNRAALRTTAVLLLCAILPALAWSARHRLVMGAWAPPKTNAPHDFALNHAHPGDGILDASVLLEAHPYFSRESRVRMAEIGELAYMQERGRAARNAILADPPEALRRLGNRAFNALLHTRASLNQIPLARAPDPELARRLRGAGLMARTGIAQETWSWLRLESSLSEVRGVFAQTGAWRNQELVLSRSGAMAFYDGFARTPFALFSGWVIATPATFALGFILLRWRKIESPAAKTLAIAYLLLIAPYILVSHSSGYHAFILPVQALLIASAASCFPLESRATDKNLSAR